MCLKPVQSAIGVFGMFVYSDESPHGNSTSGGTTLQAVKAAAWLLGHWQPLLQRKAWL